MPATRRWGGDRWPAACETFSPGGEKRKPEHASFVWMTYGEWQSVKAEPVCHSCGHYRADHQFERIETYHPSLPMLLREEIRHV